MKIKSINLSALCTKKRCLKRKEKKVVGAYLRSKSKDLHAEKNPVLSYF